MRQIKKIKFPIFTSKIIQYLIVLLVITLIAIVCKPLSNQQGYHIVSFILLFVVLILAAFLGIGPILLASMISALIWNYFFIPPHYTFHIASVEDKLMFGSFFFVALINGVLTNRIRRQEKIAIEREERTKAIYELTKDLSNTSGIHDVLVITSRDVIKYFNAYFICVFKKNATKIEILPGSENDKELSQVDSKVVEWVLNNLKAAGRFTDYFNEASLTYYPLTGRRLSPGVIAIKFDKPLSREQKTFWVAYLTQISNALERELLSELVLKARLLDESDKLYKTLFTLISHEFRIPIATIMGASDTLLMAQTTEKNRKELFDEIFKASGRLNHLVENLLNMSRLESGKISAHLDWCDINDLFNKVIQVLKVELEKYHLSSSIPSDMPLVRLDFGLMEQVVYNLILNSCQHSPSGSTIKFEAKYCEGSLLIIVEDNGPGFPLEMLDMAFNKFFRVNYLKTGGLGLGLSIVKGLVEAHKGEVKVENQNNSGARFTISIPTEIHEMKEIIPE